MSEKITAIYVKPEQKAEVIDIDNSLESLQNAVGGYIETVYPFTDAVCIVCNEEGKMLGLPLNRAIYGVESDEIVDIIAGNFLVVYAPPNVDDFQSLPDELIKRYKDMFEYPEQFARTPNGFVAFKMNDISSEEITPLEEKKPHSNDKTNSDTNESMAPIVAPQTHNIERTDR